MLAMKKVHTALGLLVLGLAVGASLSCNHICAALAHASLGLV